MWYCLCEVKESLERLFKRNGIKVSYYGEYHETDELFFVDGEKYTLQVLRVMLEIIL